MLVNKSRINQRVFSRPVLFFKELAAITATKNQPIVKYNQAAGFEKKSRITACVRDRLYGGPR